MYSQLSDNYYISLLQLQIQALSLFSASQCKTNACSFAKAKMGCSEFCGCGDEGDTNECKNKWNENQYESDDEDENEDEFEDEDEDNEDQSF